jgi:hypothetical protein
LRSRNGKYCGKIVTPKNPNGDTATCEVRDECPSCESGQVDLTLAAFLPICTVSQGICTLPGISYTIGGKAPSDIPSTATSTSTAPSSLTPGIGDLTSPTSATSKGGSKKTTSTTPTLAISEVGGLRGPGNVDGIISGNNVEISHLNSSMRG